jgi:hypothetical protein
MVGNSVRVILTVGAASIGAFFLSSNAAAATATPGGAPCPARSEAVISNIGGVFLNGGSLVDSYQSSAGPYGGSNVGSAGNVQAATSITKNGGVVRGTLTPNSPPHLAVVPVPVGAINLPLGSPTPGSLAINDAAHSLTLAPGNYVAANVNVNAPGAINVSPAGQVNVWVTGSLNLGGTENGNGFPANLQFLVTGTSSVNLNNAGRLFGIIYAPNAPVMINSSVFGSVVGSSVILNSGAAVHYDQSSACSSSNARLDQSFVAPSDLSDGLYGRPVLMAQSYTAGITGTLQGVAIDVTSFTTFVARVQIETVVGGVPSGVVLGQARASTSGNLSINTVIPFTNPIPQVAGQQYAIVVDYPDAPAFSNGQPSAGSWNGSDGNVYPRGTLLASFDNGTVWQSYASEGFDVHFQTFVVPN